MVLIGSMLIPVIEPISKSRIETIGVRGTIFICTRLQRTVASNIAPSEVLCMGWQIFARLYYIQRMVSRIHLFHLCITYTMFVTGLV
jgi:hypothetical protein